MGKKVPLFVHTHPLNLPFGFYRTTARIAQSSKFEPPLVLLDTWAASLVVGLFVHLLQTAIPLPAVTSRSDHSGALEYCVLQSSASHLLAKNHRQTRRSPRLPLW